LNLLLNFVEKVQKMSLEIRKPTKKSADFKKMPKVVQKTFNELSIPVCHLRQKLIEYYHKSPKEEMKRYRVCDTDGGNAHVEIKADSQLGCIIMFKDYLNETFKTYNNKDASNNSDSFNDDVFFEIYAETVDVTDSDSDGLEDENAKTMYDGKIRRDREGVEKIFESKDIKDIMADYIESCFGNDTLWFEEIPDSKVVLTCVAKKDGFETVVNPLLKNSEILFMLNKISLKDFRKLINGFPEITKHSCNV